MFDGYIRYTKIFEKYFLLLEYEIILVLFLIFKNPKNNRNKIAKLDQQGIVEQKKKKKQKPIPRLTMYCKY